MHMCEGRIFVRVFKYESVDFYFRCQRNGRLLFADKPKTSS